MIREGNLRPFLTDEQLREAALIAYVAKLSKIVKLDTLAPCLGEDGYDLYVRVPARQMHSKTQRVVELEYAILDEFGVRFRTFCIATD